jgi:hypothetical protein
MYAYIAFDWKTREGEIKISGQGKHGPALYKIRPCTTDIWVLKKNNVAIAQMKKVKGLVAKFTSWELVVSPGVDIAFVICIANICDWFQRVPVPLMTRL